MDVQESTEKTKGSATNFTSIDSETNVSQKMTTVLLNEFNYLPWSRAVTIALGGRSRLGFINGKEIVPDSSSPEFDSWLAKDQMVMSWLLNSMERQFAEMFSYYQSSQELWEAVKDMYGSQNNSARIFQIQQEIAGLHRNGQPFVNLLSKFKGLWNELDVYRPHSVDPVVLRRRKEEDQIFQLLASLGSDYEDLRSHVLMNDELPPLKSVIATIQREEIRRKVMPRENSSKIAEARAFVAQKTHEPGIPKFADKQPFKGNRSSLKCNYCHSVGHQMDRCWILHPELKPKNLGNRQQFPKENPKKFLRPRAHVAAHDSNFSSPMSLLTEFASFLQEKQICGRNGGEGSSGENGELGDASAFLSHLGLTRENGSAGLTREAAAGLTRESTGLTHDYAEKFQGPLHQTEDW